MFISIHPSFYFFSCPSNHQYICISIQSSICLSIQPPFYCFPVHVSIHLSFSNKFISIQPSINFFIYFFLSIQPSIIFFHIFFIHPTIYFCYPCCCCRPTPPVCSCGGGRQPNFSREALPGVSST